MSEFLEKRFNGTTRRFPLQIQPQLEAILHNPGRLNYFEPRPLQIHG